MSWVQFHETRRHTSAQAPIPEAQEPAEPDVRQPCFGMHSGGGRRVYDELHAAEGGIANWCDRLACPWRADVCRGSDVRHVENRSVLEMKAILYGVTFCGGVGSCVD